MVLYFENSNSKVRRIGKIDGRMNADRIRSEVFHQIGAFLDEHNFKSYYMRIWSDVLRGKPASKIDVGSYTEFFYTVPPMRTGKSE